MKSNIDKQMSHIKSLETLVKSKDIKIIELEKEISRMKRFYMTRYEKLEKAFDFEYKRAELLQYDLNMADDFILEVCDKYALKYSRKPS